MKIKFLFVISLCLFGMSLPASAAINAWLDQYQVSPGETVQLTLQHDGQTSSQPDLNPLKQDFEIIGRSSSSNMQIVNGKMSSQVQLNLTLVPKHNGKLQIPVLQWDGQTSPPLTVTVSSNAATGQASPGQANTTNSRHVFIVASLVQQHPYVQAEVPLTVRIYTDRPLYQASLDFPSSSDVMIKQVGHDHQGNEMRDGRNYQVIERHYLLFPQRSGHIELGGPVLNAQVQNANNNPFGSSPFGSNAFFSNIFGRNPFAGMLNSTRPIRVQGDPVVLNALPQPAGSNGHNWLPAKNVTLQETWQPDHGGTIHAGDPVTLHLHLSATGLLAAQLPDLSQLMSLPADVKAYPDQPKMSNSTAGNNVVGTRDQDIALIADNSGHYVIPAMHLFWWDTDNNTQQEIDLPEHTLNILPGTAAISAGMSPPPGNTSANQSSAVGNIATTPEKINVIPTVAHGWKRNWISLVLAILWLGTLAAWWISNRRNAARSNGTMSAEPEKKSMPAPRMAEARRAFHQACRENNPQAARRHLLDWACATWPQHPPGGLKALAKRLDDPVLEPLLQQLDRACYAGGEWRGESLLKSLQTLPEKPMEDSGASQELAGLYP